MFKCVMVNEVAALLNRRPDLSIYQRRGRLIETLPALHNIIRTGPRIVVKRDADDDRVGGDEAADALRYLLVTK